MGLSEIFERLVGGKKISVLVIYDISNDKKRTRLAKVLQGYGERVQQSAFEASINKRKYQALVKQLKRYAGKNDSIRIYKIEEDGIQNFGKAAKKKAEGWIII